MSTVRRVIKHKVGQYTPAQIRVRDATSNDAAVPTTAQLDTVLEDAEDLFHQDDVFYVIWKRLNDDGKNWRHVHKSLLVLEHMLKRGSRRIVEQVLQQPIAVSTLKNFVFIDKDGVDQGSKVRDVAIVVDTLIREARHKNEELMQPTFNGSLLASSPESGPIFDRPPSRSPSVTALAGGDNDASPTGDMGPQSAADEADQVARAIAQSQRLAAEEQMLRQLDATNLKAAKELSLKLSEANVVSGRPAPVVQVDPWGVKTDGSDQARSPARDPWGVAKERKFSDAPAFGGPDLGKPAETFTDMPFSPAPFVAPELSESLASDHQASPPAVLETRPGRSFTMPPSLDDLQLSSSPATSASESGTLKPTFLDSKASAVVDLDDILNDNFKRKQQQQFQQELAPASLNALRVSKSISLAGNLTPSLADPLIPLAETRSNPNIARGMTWNPALHSTPTSPAMQQRMMLHASVTPSPPPAIMAQPMASLPTFGAASTMVPGGMAFANLQAAPLTMQASTPFVPTQGAFQTHTSNPFHH